MLLGDTVIPAVIAPVFQLYVPPALAVSVVPVPLQMVVVPLIVGLGLGFTTTTCWAVPLHNPLVTVTL